MGRRSVLVGVVAAATVAFALTAWGCSQSDRDGSSRSKNGSSGAGASQPPAGGGSTTTPPASGGGGTGSTGGGTTTPPAGGGGATTPPSGGGGTTTPPAGGGGTTTPPPSGGGTTTPPSGGGGGTSTPPPFGSGGGGGGTPPPSGGGTPPPSGGGGSTPPPSGGGGGTPPPATAGFAAVEVTATTLNARSGPGTGFDIIGEAHAGERYVAFESNGSWRRIWFYDTPAWCHGSYLQDVPGATVGAVTTISLNVRTGPGTSYDRIGRTYFGALWVVSASQGDWRQIDFDGREAWVYGPYLGDPLAAPGSIALAPARPQSSRGFIQLPASGAGFYCYSPESRRWGQPRMIYGMERVGLYWDYDHPTWPRMGVGDVSLENGGPISGHASHQKGVDVDIRPVRSDGVEGGTTIFDSTYSQAGTAELIDRFYSHLPVTMVFFNDTAVAGTQTWPNHDNHFHARIEE